MRRGGDTVQVGWSATGAPICLPVTTILHKHLLLTGATGSGKTGVTLSLVLETLARHPDTNLLVIDGKGELVSELVGRFLPALATVHPRLAPENVTTIRPWSAYGVGMNPLARLPLELAVQCRIVANLIDSLGGGLGHRMHAILAGVLPAVLELEGSLLDAVRILTNPDVARQAAERVRSVDTRSFLLDRLPRERPDSIAAVVSRLSLLLELPAVRAALTSRTSITGADLIESPVVLCDVGSTPTGFRDLASFFGGYCFALAVAAMLSRQDCTRRVLVVIDEAQVVVRLAPEDVENALAQARHKGVAMLLALQSLAQIDAVSPALTRSLVTNSHTQWFMQPQAADLKHVPLSVSGRRVDPVLRDTVLTPDAERRALLEQYVRLPPRWGVLWDRVAGTTTALQSVNVPYERAAQLTATQSAEVRERYWRGRLGVPIAELAAQGVSPLAAVEPLSRPGNQGEPPAPRPTRTKPSTRRLVLP